MPDQDLTPLGKLLEHARTEVLRISARQAAMRAGISGTRWKQVVTGVASRSGEPTPVRSTARTIVSMARAVNVDPAEALQAAGIPASDESVAAMVQDAEAPRPTRPPVRSQSLVDEIERIGQMRWIAPKDRIRMVNALVDLYEQEAAEAAKE